MKGDRSARSTSGASFEASIEIIDSNESGSVDRETWRLFHGVISSCGISIFGVCSLRCFHSVAVMLRWKRTFEWDHLCFFDGKGTAGSVLSLALWEEICSCSWYLF